MKKIEITLKGRTPLLIHSAMGMLNTPSVTKNPAKVYDPEEEAEKVVYRNEKGNIYIPARCIKACVLNASSWYKSGRKSIKPILAGSMLIEPYEIEVLDAKGKPIKEYVIDKRPVVVQRSRIVRCRPRLDEWYVKFTISYNEKLIADTELIHKILEEAGQRIGLLDNRPQKYGDNGTFTVEKFLPEK